MDYNSSMGNVSLNMLNVSNGGGWRYSHRYSLEVDSRGGSVPGTRLTLVTGDGGSHQLWLRVPIAGQNDSDGFSQFDITGRNSYGTKVSGRLEIFDYTNHPRFWEAAQAHRAAENGHESQCGHNTVKFSYHHIYV